MQTWRIERTPDGHAGLIAVAGDRRQRPRPPPPIRGSSIDDLSREVLPKIVEKKCASESLEVQEIKKEKEIEQTLFRTGSGKLVPTSDSSIEKAKALFESNTGEFIDGTGQFPIFQTGSGRPVSVKQSSVEKARAFLEIDHIEELIGNGSDQIPIFKTGSGRPVSLDQNSIKKARTLLEIEPKGKQIPIFQTGSGRPVSLDQNSINKARALLEIDPKEEQVPIFQTGSGRSGSLDQNSLNKAKALLEIDPKEEQIPIFKTGSGRPVLVNQSPIHKARTVLETHISDEKEIPVLRNGSARPVMEIHNDEEGFGNQSSIHTSMTILENDKNEEINGDTPIFATGSGRPVSVCKDSIQKARAILENDKIDERCAEIPMFEIGSGRPVLMSENSMQKARALLENDKNGKGDIPIFATGSGRPVSLNDNSIEKARAVSENNKKGGAEMQMFHTGLGRPVPISENSIEKAKLILEGGKSSKADERCEDIPMFETGSGRPVSVSENSIQKARALLENDKHELEKECEDIPMFATGSGRPVSLNKNSIERARALLENDKNGNGDLPMFETGSGRPVSLNKNSIEKARAILENEKNVILEKRCGDIPMFATGSGRPVSVCKDSLQKARAILENGKNEEKCGDIPMFETGSGRPVSVSENSIQKARAIFENENKEERCGDIPLFATGSGRPVSVSKNSIENARAILENNKHEERYGDIPMFETGPGRPVSLNKNSIDKARSILENGKNVNEGNGDLPMFETGSGRPVSVSENSLQKARAFLENNKNEQTCEDIPMFETGSGRPVSVSNNSIQKARALFENNKNVEICGDFPMFETGSGRPVSVSNNSMNKARTLLENNKIEQTCGHFPMFETGSGRPVSVSENSIQKARAMLENDKNGGAEMQMFQTGLGRAVPISESSIEKAKRILEAGNGSKGDIINGDCGAQLPLFQTGLGRPVLISETSISKARAVLAAQNGDLHGEINTNLHITPSKSAKFPSHNISRATTLLGLDETDLSATQISNHSNNNNNNNFISPYKDSHRDPCGALQGLSTASGRPILVSNEALNRAKGLLGNPNLENETFEREEMKDLHVIKGNRNPNFENETFQRKEITKDLHGNPYLMKDLHVIKGNNNNAIITSGSSVDLNNQIGKGNCNNNIFGSKKRGGKTSTISPFKRPRNSRFITPLNNSASFIPPGPSKLTKLQNGCQKTRVSTHYPFQHERKTLKEIFSLLPSFKNSEDLPDEIKQINSDSAEKFVFKNEPKNLGIDFECVGSDEFRVLLIQAGATSSHATKEWVSNHYKRIVWKLACYERVYPNISFGKYLTVSNVLEELKYRYEREANFGHRSAIKKILDGDASPSFMMILCVSKIISSKVNNPDSNSNDGSIVKHESSTPSAKIVLTDGWYSLEASLDVILTKQLFAKKIFVGQKIRIWGASLCGWVGPVSFLEANGTVSLSLHINGTYRASWDEPLGFCKKIGPPLAFKCIKSSGGVIPMTLVGIKRVYPLLYKERLSNGASIVRSERMETDALQLYHQRRSNIAEDIISKQQEICSNLNSNEHCEGSKISKLIEKSAEPEVLMAGLNSEQLNSLFSYHSKQKEIRQGEMGKKIEKALEKAGLGARDISPFMKLRIVGLNCINSSKKGRNKEGLVTIWNPTDRHKMELVEGKMYKVLGLTPSNFGGEILYLQARGSSTIWRPLHSLQSDYFESFFTPRKAVQLCNLGEVPLASEFDIAGSVLFVGDVYISDQQKRQWVFISDGSNIESESEETCCDSILAINFFSPLIHNDDSSLKLFNHTLQGSTVGFLNLVKRARDQNENIWLAEATEYSTYSLSSNLKNNTSRLKEAATSAEKWAKTSPSSIERLRERVSCLINCQGK